MMASPKICTSCEVGDHDSCVKKKRFGNLYDCDCYICKK